jgi:hypothetical protein
MVGGGGRLTLYVLKRLRIDSRLSSLRPLYLARPRILCSRTGRGHSKKSITGSAASAPKTSCHPAQFSSERGKPSMRKLHFPLFAVSASMAFLSRPTVMVTGMILPLVWYSSIRAAFSLPDARSARRRSPALRCVQPSWFMASSHMVPFPAPGPPRTKTTFCPPLLAVARGSLSWIVIEEGSGPTPFFAYTSHAAMSVGGISVSNFPGWQGQKACR